MGEPYNEYDELLGTERHKEQPMYSEDTIEAIRMRISDLLLPKTEKEQAMTWELIDVTKEPDWIQDGSGVYTVIYRIPHTATGTRPADVRLDLISAEDNEPIRSWQGTAAAVRKVAMRWIEHYDISAEHASYIGEQLALAAVLSDFVQD